MVLGVAIMCIAGGSRALALEAEQVRETIRRVGDWQLANPVDLGALHWAVAPLLDGFFDLSLATGYPKYLAVVVRAGTREGWRPGPSTYHADDLAAGHPWTRIYLMDPTRAERLAPFKKRVDEILAKSWRVFPSATIHIRPASATPTVGHGLTPSIWRRPRSRLLPKRPATTATRGSSTASSSRYSIRFTTRRRSCSTGTTGSSASHAERQEDLLEPR